MASRLVTQNVKKGQLEFDENYILNESSKDFLAMTFTKYNFSVVHTANALGVSHHTVVMALVNNKFKLVAE